MNREEKIRVFVLEEWKCTDKFSDANRFGSNKGREYPRIRKQREDGKNSWS